MEFSNVLAAHCKYETHQKANKILAQRSLPLSFVTQEGILLTQESFVWETLLIRDGFDIGFLTCLHPNKSNELCGRQ